MIKVNRGLVAVALRAVSSLQFLVSAFTVRNIIIKIKMPVCESKRNALYESRGSPVEPTGLRQNGVTVFDSHLKKK